MALLATIIQCDDHRSDFQILTDCEVRGPLSLLRLSALTIAIVIFSSAENKDHPQRLLDELWLIATTEMRNTSETRRVLISFDVWSA